MVWRSLVRRTRSSREASSGADGARTATGAGAGTGGRRRSRDRRGGLGDRLEHVALQHLPALARAGDAGDVDAALGGDLGGGGRGRHGGRARRRDRGLAAGAAAAALAGAAAATAAAPAAPSEPSSAPIATVVAGLRDDLRQHAGGGRVDFERHLFGLEFDQRLVRLHDVAALLEPFADRRLGDRLAEGGNANFSGHVHIAPQAAPFC